MRATTDELNACIYKMYEDSVECGQTLIEQKERLEKSCRKPEPAFHNFVVKQMRCTVEEADFYLNVAKRGKSCEGFREYVENIV